MGNTEFISSGLHLATYKRNFHRPKCLEYRAHDTPFTVDLITSVLLVFTLFGLDASDNQTPA
jgi:hypothetical protein